MRVVTDVPIGEVAGGACSIFVTSAVLIASTRLPLTILVMGCGMLCKCFPESDLANFGRSIWSDSASNSASTGIRKSLRDRDLEGRITEPGRPFHQNGETPAPRTMGKIVVSLQKDRSSRRGRSLQTALKARSCRATSALYPVNLRTWFCLAVQVASRAKVPSPTRAQRAQRPVRLVPGAVLDTSGASATAWYSSRKAAFCQVQWNCHADERITLD